MTDKSVISESYEIVHGHPAWESVEKLHEHMDKCLKEGVITQEEYNTLHKSGSTDDPGYEALVGEVVRIFLKMGLYRKHRLSYIR